MELANSQQPEMPRSVRDETFEAKDETQLQTMGCELQAAIIRQVFPIVDSVCRQSWGWQLGLRTKLLIRASSPMRDHLKGLQSLTDRSKRKEE
jgi:hypothetical protein